MFLSPSFVIQIDGSDDRYMIHKEVLRQRCPILAKQCDSQPDQKGLRIAGPMIKEALAIFIKWMYTDSVHFVKDESEAFVAVRTYLFAKMFDMGTFPNLLLKRLETFYENNTIDDKVFREMNKLRWKRRDDELYEFLVKQVAKKTVKLNWLGRQGEAKDLREELFKQGKGSLWFLLNTQHVFQAAFNDECRKRNEEDTKDGELGRGLVPYAEMIDVMFDSMKLLVELDTDTSKESVGSKTSSDGEDRVQA